MYKNKKICIAIPCYNEATQIGKVIETMPDFVDQIVIVNDCSTDDTANVVSDHQKKYPGLITLLNHEKNQGVGASLATGYKYVTDKNYDVVVRMDGDGQMKPDELSSLLDPVVEGKADYAKGNRLFTGEAYEKIPKVRFFGNAFLSFLTKIASGYWHIADFQSGYTAMNNKALNTINWDKMYKSYGQPNDLLVRLNVYNFRVTDVPVEPIYDVGEKSGIKIRKVIFTISWLLIRLFFWRMKEKYVIRDFHPLILFYGLGIFFSFTTLFLFFRVMVFWILFNHIPPINALAAFFSFTSASIFILFAMWFDMEANKDLK